MFSGGVRRRLRQILLRFDARTVRFCYSLLQCKRCSDAVDESFVQQCLEKHRKTLSTPSGPVSDGLRERIRAKAIALISGWTTFKDKLYEPSPSACWEVGRCAGGALAFIQDRYPECSNQLLTMFEEAPGLVVSRYGWVCPPHGDLWSDCEREELTGYSQVDELVVDQPFVSASKISVHEPLGRMTCRVAAVLEPFKVRTVTKGRALPYFMVHSVQKWMHTNLRRLPQFRLIGEPVTSAIIEKFMERRRPGELFVSGDYSAATDNLKLEVTKIIFEVILSRIEIDLGVSHPILETCRKVLYEHEIHYPKDSGIDPTLQATGQLMGSPLSFPVLCLANAICYWLCLCPEKKFNRLDLLVNGDDILFHCTRDEYSAWSEAIKEFGFVKSVGKNYANDRFAMINSELFDANFSKTGRCCLPYFPAGLMMGRSKVRGGMTTDLDSDEPEPIVPTLSNLELVLRGSSNPTLSLSRYMVWNKEMVQLATESRRNIFMPISRGGCGVKSYGARTYFHEHDVPVEEAVSRWQLQYARYLEKQPYLKTLHWSSDDKQIWKKTFRIPDVDWIRPNMPEYYLRSEKSYGLDLMGCGPIGWRHPAVSPAFSMQKLRDREVYKISKEDPIPLHSAFVEVPYRFSSYVPVMVRDLSELPAPLLPQLGKTVAVSTPSLV
jgi:hypothetical protein